MKKQYTIDNKMNLNLIIDGSFVGLFTGLSVSLFKYIVRNMNKHLKDVSHETFYGLNSVVLILPLFIILGFIIGKMVKKEKSIGGSGIARVKSYVEHSYEISSLREFVYKYIGSLIVLSSGLTAGTVGPSVHFGAMTGISLGKIKKRDSKYSSLLALSGIAAGICALFSAPLAGIIFVLEVVTDDADENVLIVMLSSVASSLLITSLFYNEPVLALKDMPVLPFSHYHIVFVLIIFSIIFAKVFNYLLLKTFVIMDKIPLKNEYLPIIPLALTGMFYFLNREYVGFDFEFLLGRTDSKFIYILLMYFLIKCFLTLLTFGSRVPGGLFYPLIFLGAVGGIIVFNLSSNFLILESEYIINFMALGIVAFITGVYKSPLTAAVIILELTANFIHLLPVIFVVLLVQMGTNLLDVEAAHEILLRNKDYFE